MNPPNADRYKGRGDGSRPNLWEHLVRLREEHGTTIFLTTHYLEEADAMAERVLVIDEGRVIADGSPEELKAGMAGDLITIGTSSPADASRAAMVAGRLDSPREITIDGSTVRLRTVGGATALPAIGVIIGLLILGTFGIGLGALSHSLAMAVKRQEYLFWLVQQTLLFPLLLLSGILRPLDFAPGWLQALSRLNPLTYVVEVVRALFAGDRTVDRCRGGRGAGFGDRGTGRRDADDATRGRMTGPGGRRAIRRLLGRGQVATIAFQPGCAADAATSRLRFPSAPGFEPRRCLLAPFMSTIAASACGPGGWIKCSTRRSIQNREPRRPAPRLMAGSRRPT